MLRRLTVFSCAAFGFAAASIAAETHTVDLATPWTPGQRFTATVTVTESSHMTFASEDRILQEQSQRRAAHFEADAEALAVHPNGGLRKAGYTVRTLRVSLDDQAEGEFLPAGTRLVAESLAPGEKTYSVNDHPATAEQEAILKLVLSLDSEKHNDQVVFGPRQAVAVNETWTPDPAILRELHEKEFGRIGAIQASMRLKGIEGSGDSQVAIIAGTLDFTNIQPPLPPGITPRSGRFQARLDGRIPARHKASTRIEAFSATTDITGETTAPDGRTILFAVAARTRHASELAFP